MNMKKGILAVLLLVLLSGTQAFADYWVTYSGDGTKGPIRDGWDVEWANGDTKIVSEEVIGWYQANSGSFTVTEVTTTGAEVNGLDGLTAAVAELNKLDGVTSTFTELNYTDVTTVGTAQASKAVTTDANIDTTGQRNITATGLVQAADVTSTDDTTVGDDLTVTGGAAVNESLTVTGATTVGGDVTVSSDPTGGNAGARSQVIGLPRIKYVGLSTMVNGTTETTAYIDETPTGEWAEVDAGTNVAVTADTTYYRDVTNSLKVAFGATAVAGDGVDGTITVDDLSANESVGFWAYTDATTAVASGDFALTLDDTDGTDQTYVLPALTSGVWTWVELNIAACDANCNTTDGVKVLLTTQGALKYGVSTGEAVNLYLDAMYKWDADNEEALGVSIVQDGVLGILTLVDANTGTHGQASLTEYTDFFTHYETGADFIVTVSDQSTKSGTALIAY